jgi:RNA polymerase sigma-70 factor (ECF subfamily)
MLDFDGIHDEFRPKITRYLSRLVGKDEAEDLVQEVFTRIDHALPDFRADSKVSTWVYRIATNAAFDRLRSRSSEQAAHARLHGEEAASTGRPGVEQELARREMNDCVRQYIEALPPGYRAVVILSEDEGLTNPEIAEALGISLDTVKIRLHRARRRLKKALGTGCSFYRDERNEFACAPKGGVSPGD